MLAYDNLLQMKVGILGSGLIEDIGFVPIETGSLREGGRLQQPGSSIYTKRLTEEQARTALIVRKSP